MSRQRTRKNDHSNPLGAVIGGVVLLLFALAESGALFNAVKGMAPYLAAFLILVIGFALLKRSGAAPTRVPTTSMAASTGSSTGSVVAAVQSPLLTSLAKTPPGAKHDDDAAQPWDPVMSLYSLRTNFFSRSEGAFYRAITHAVSNRYAVFAKVRLLDICADIPHRDYSAMNRIAAKHVDFLLCELTTFEPVAAIEVDGSSHHRPDRIERDAFVDDLFNQLGLPLIRVTAASWFEPTDLQRRIEEAIAAS